MTARLLLPVLLLALAGAARAEGPALPPGDPEPFLRVEAGGPTSYVTALAFSADGRRLYAGGWDKVVRVWALDAKGRFVPDRVPAYRLPVGPGLDGAINALALSDDGVWLAAGGYGVGRDAAGFRQPGFVVPSAGGMSDDQRRDVGAIYVFNTRDQSVRLLRGHRGAVEALAFAPAYPGKPPLLLSAARERDAEAATFHTAVRLWDVDRGESVAALAGPPAPEVVRPGLAVWHTGRGVNQVRAALALYDGALRVWDAEHPDRAPSQVSVHKYNMTVARVPSSNRDGPGRLLTADPGEDAAPLSLWKVSDAGKPEPVARQQRRGRVSAFPRALELLSRNGDGTPDLAAVVVQEALPGKKYQYRLQVVDLSPDALGAVRADQTLWEGSPRQPALATSLGGRHLAVAGNKDHEIFLYSLPGVLHGEKAPAQVLHGSGIPFRHASFVRKGDGLGLLLNRAPRKSAGQAPPAPDRDQGDLVFPFTKPRLSADLAGWETAAPEPAGWEARPTVDGDRRSVSVSEGDRPRGRIGLRPDEDLSDFALLPPHGALKVPLLALATHTRGQPRLEVYDAASAALLRQFTGHVERIDSLAFSADGRLLVSAAEDQTVRVWSLTDIGDVLGRRGGLPGVRVRQAKGGLVVTQVEDGSPARGKLHKGDVLAGLVERGKLRRLDSPLAFFGALFRAEPGKEITLRRGDTAGNDDVTLTVGQGADERKPLFSLFAIRSDRGDKVEDADWIGWNPIGPYESSSPRAERFLGWHFNTGDPKAPTRFALAAAHQKEYYRPGVLRKLVAKGKLDLAERLPPARPELVLLVEEAGQPRAVGKPGPLVVNHPRVTLKMEVRDRPLGELAALTWKLDGGAERPLPLDGPGAGEFEAPLELRRGDHQVIVTATTRDRPPQAVPVGVALHYQPPKPQVEHEGEKGQRFVKEAAYNLKALVRPGLAEEPVTVAVHQWHDGKDLLGESKTYTIDPAKPLVIDRRLELRPGNNVLEVVAVNRDAPRDRQADETDRLALEVFYVQKARPPVITLTGVRVPGNDNVIKVEPSQPVVVHVPAVTLVGKIEATENLAVVERLRGDAVGGTRLAGFEPGKAKEFTLAEKLALQPGTQTFRLRARTVTSDTAERSLTVDYRPPLPAVGQLKVVPPQPGDTFYGEADTATVHLEGRVVPPDDRQPYRAVVLVNGKEAAAAPVLDENAGTLTAAVVVGPGDSYIRVRLSNAWGMTADGMNEVHVRYLRPPRVLEVKRVQADGKPFLNLEARVRSPLPLLPKSVRVEVNGQDVAAVPVQVQQPENGVGLLRLREVPLEAGSKENRIAVRVSNAEAECRTPGIITVETAAVLPPPVVEILEPGQNVDVSRPELSVSYRVRSASPLTAARLTVEGQPPLALDGTKAVRDEDSGQWELAGEVAVTLGRGFNHLRLEAVNGSGRRTTDPVVVNYVPPPFRLAVESLEPVRGAAAPVRAVAHPGGRFDFPGGVGQGHVRLRGRILWGDGRAARGAEGLRIRVFVNGFQQARARLGPAGGDETPFTADLLLSWEKNNHVSLVALGQDADNRCEFDVDCRQPVARQRLHLLVLSPGGQDADGLRTQVLRAVGVPPDAERLRTPAFAEVKSYRPLVGAEVGLARVTSELYAVRNAIELGRVSAPMNDVVLIYYQGGETIDDRGNVFRAAGGPGQAVPEDLGIPCDRLVDFLADTPGAHLLLLDVERGAQPAGGRARDLRDKIAHWDDYYPQAEAQFSVLRYVWREKANPPPQAHLLAAVGSVLPHAARLSDLLRLLDERVAAGKNAALLIYTKYAPPDLEELLVGAAR